MPDNGGESGGEMQWKGRAATEKAGVGGGEGRRWRGREEGVYNLGDRSK